ncbi:Aurofusarin cluster transcription factor aurR2 [Lachnellula arida]|uniref:Aurofusarin cluster transcription factor aurR2 n=1 Tax=Lachnellula arida TaxID=1316785 RepID=A0A8T9B8T1_9HELO|nr:Aurofusarin cluster transcription factor aurR2 [Lachnellula arida]
MSGNLPTPDMTPPGAPSKPQRILACVRCQQRKIKCDRKFPCANCNTSRAQCVPATLTQRGRRKRRFPERELLERLRKYEDLLSRNHIDFEPLHKGKDTNSPGEKEVSTSRGGRGDESENEQPGAVEADCPSPSASIKSERVHEAKDYWRSLNSSSREPGNDSDSSQEDMRGVFFQKSWVQLYGDNDHLLFGSQNGNIDLSTLHPDPVQIFRLWQIYLDNVNPLLKVTHTPSLQGRIIEAVSNLATISPTLEALLFSIYCMAVSLTEDDCQAIFGSSQEDLLTRFQFGCQQALLNCGFLRTNDRDCLTALFLYLFSVRPRTVPQSLSAMLGVAIRIAQRMGIHSESALAKCTVFEAELRRRLWWSLMLFDSRISEMADHKTATLNPTWDCRIPLNVNDSDIRPELKESPLVQGNATDAIFAVVRGEIAEFVRHSAFNLNFTNPALKRVVKTGQHDLAKLAILEKMIEDKYLRYCDPDNPLHFMTIWWTRAHLARCRLLEYHSSYSNSSVRPTDTQREAQREASISHALCMLECDTKFATSALVKGFLWQVNVHFPFPAFIHILQDLKRRPFSAYSEQAWESMSDNTEARALFMATAFKNPFLEIFANMVLEAWEAREAAVDQLREPMVPPRIVSFSRARAAQKAPIVQVAKTQQPSFESGMGMDMNNLQISMPTSSGSHGQLYDMGGQSGYGVMDSLYPNIPGQAPLDVDMNSIDWATMDWGLGGVYPGFLDAEF